MPRLSVEGRIREAYILALQHNARPSARRFEDGLGQRIGRITQQVANLQSFEFDWNRLCDRHYAAKS